MTTQDDPVMVLRIHLHGLPCPTCGSHELVPTLQCDYYPDGCLWLVRCERCRAQYHLDRRSRPTWTDDARTVAPAEPASV
jgi:hypothetical protein